ncbi:hypothetical protein GCM10009677_31950 [Sphaerisporangium rubeum]|uniref:Uncharacterized protein n=1 Tax=Sphaerisporangium rubeum TaxID=321317 RepID=A0A7X0M752_9ACTN|nr:hypothetical protein [Sphaerisporangium rubeum]MBB6472491.1 hypothetical protein [Sphaerisporangium rubeum]
MAPEQTSRPTRAPAWPESPPPWPEMPPPSAPPSSSSRQDPAPRLPGPPQHAGHPDHGPHTTGPQRYDTPAPPAYAPQPSGPHQYPPQTGPQGYTPRSTGPQEYTPQPTGPQHHTPQPTGPQQYAPRPTGPQQYTPRPTGPQEYTPQPTGPQQYTPRPTGPQEYSPQPSGPQHHTPQPTGPQEYTPQPSGPHHHTPQPTGPQHHTPQPSGPQQDGPAARQYTPPGTETTVRLAEAAAPARTAPAPGRRRRPENGPGGGPEDPERRFVTAGQISGPKTPPPERQQQLWNTVFGDNYEAIGEAQDDEGGGGKRVWLLALVASVAVALVAALLWAFLAGPLRSAPESGSASGDGGASGAASPPAAKPSASAKPPAATRLPKYRGTASPVAGTVSDDAAGLNVPRLGGQWRLDTRTDHIRTTYGFETRQYVPAGQDTAGKPQFAQLMTGPLAKSLGSKYSPDEPQNLTPVISAVAFAARGKFFPEGNKVVKTAEQRLTAGGKPARVVAYQVTAGEQKTTMVVAAVSTGADLPSIVYMAVPEAKKALLPDVTTVFTSIRPFTGVS